MLLTHVEDGLLARQPDAVALWALPLATDGPGGPAIGSEPVELVAKAKAMGTGRPPLGLGPFSQFRLVGLPSASGQAIAPMPLAGFELYGTLAVGADPQWAPVVVPAAPTDVLTLVPSGVDFDESGLLYWLGCTAGTTAWRNPAEAGAVEVSASSLQYDSVPIAAVRGVFDWLWPYVVSVTKWAIDKWVGVCVCVQLVGRTAQRCVTRSIQAEWMQI